MSDELIEGQAYRLPDRDMGPFFYLVRNEENLLFEFNHNNWNTSFIEVPYHEVYTDPINFSEYDQKTFEKWAKANPIIKLGDTVCTFCCFNGNGLAVLQEPSGAVFCAPYGITYQVSIEAPSQADRMRQKLALSNFCKCTEADIELEAFENENGVILLRDRHSKRPLKGIVSLTISDCVDDLPTAEIKCYLHKKSN